MSGQSAVRAPRAIHRILIAVVFTAVVIVLILALAGVFHRKIPAQTVHAAPTVGRPADGVATAAARLVALPAVETAVGTIQAVHETTIGSELLAKVVEVGVVAGQRISKGDVLVRLADDDLRARLEQASATIRSARSARDLARTEFERIERLFAQQAAASIERDRAERALESAEAELQRAEQARREAQTLLGYATITSPIDGIVVEKRVEAGDMVTPGQALLTLYDPLRMQLVASVRESLAGTLTTGQPLSVWVDALEKDCLGEVSEIVPQADPVSRSFLVKVTGPCPPGIRSGMFGRLRIPLDEEQVLVIPQAAVRRVGQLELVDVVEEGRLYRRAVRVGRVLGDVVEILSGLHAGEFVAVEPSRDRQGAGRATDHSGRPLAYARGSEPAP